MRLWERDLFILDALDKSILSTGQLSKLFFPSRKKCSERLNMLFLSGLVSRFQKPFLDVIGRPEFIYCKKGRRVKGFFWIKHQLAITDFRLWLLQSLPKDVSFEFFYSSVFSKDWFGGLFIPDGALVLSKGKKRLLYFLEVDLGTEALSSSHYSFLDKVALYENYFDSKIYLKDLNFLNYSFKGFRVLVVFNSVSRRRLFESETNNNFFLCSTWNDLEELGSKLGIKGGINSGN